MLVLNLKSYRRLSIEEKENIRQKAFQEIRTFPKAPPKRDLTAHLCIVLNLSYTLAQRFVMLYDQTSASLGGNKRIGVSEYNTFTLQRKNHLKHAIFNYYCENYGSVKMVDIQAAASKKFNVSKHLIRGIAPRRDDLKVSVGRLPCGNII